MADPRPCQDSWAGGQHSGTATGTPHQRDKLTFGDAALDMVLGGGLPHDSLYILTGPPGAGKTILPQQLSFSAARARRRVVYFTNVSEPHAKIVQHIRCFCHAGVLIVDDEDYVGDMIGAALEIEGYTAHLAYNGRDGLEVARQSTADLAIIDVIMPYMGGPSMIGRLRDMEQWRAVPVVLISEGSRPPPSVARCTFVAKPLDLDELIALAARLTGREKSDGS